ncbi:MAG TPA: cohesin domain-containing protein [Candidatus Paceibacterota bacterium]|nr:cohesin domain-containing protein [Candidatus Paceibacterota bacterium]
MFLVGKKIFIIGVILGLLSSLGTLAYAADFGLSASKNTYEVGETIPVKIYVASPNQSSNAVSGVVSYPNDKLQVSSLAKTGSVVNMWVQEPAYYNGDGQVNFEGVILNPGYTGKAGVILTINFKARQTGTAQLNFANGSILANDGAGTNILQKLGQLSLTIVPASTKPASVSPVLSPPLIKSPIATTTLETDKTPPEQLAIIEVASGNPRRARFSFSANDSQSGIDYYQFSIDGLIVGRLPFGSDTYETLDQISGSHQFGIIVTDRAGNSIEETINFEIRPADWFNLGLLNSEDSGIIFIILTSGFVVLLILFVLFFLLRGFRRVSLSSSQLSSGVSPLNAKIVFRGRSEATQAVVLLRNGQIVAETKPGADSVFEFSLDNLPAGFQHFSLVTVEALGNPTLTQDYPVMLSAGASVVVSGVEIKRPRFSQTSDLERPVENFIKNDINYPERNV